VADGEGGNHRVIVLDADTGAFKRFWDAYGQKPEAAPAPKYDPNGAVPKTFSSAVHCVRIANDDSVYICDRGNDRIQVFHKNGTFVKEVFIARGTLGLGSTSDVDFSPDQNFLYVADGTNQKVWILDRHSLEVVGSFGQLGHDAGEFRNLHDLVVDSKGNIYTGETQGKRVQKFLPY
jgi:DNA-binding beta-propeller fold protein YncE